MKTCLRFFFFGLLVLAFQSCDKDENNTNASLAGTWKLTDIHCDNGVSETTLLGQHFNSTYNFHGTQYNTTTTFTENPNEFTSTGSYTVITNVTLQGQTSSDTTTVDAFAGTGTWDINGKTMTQVFAGETSTFEILELSDSKLRLKDELDATVVDSIFGATIHDKATVFSTFERQ